VGGLHARLVKGEGGDPSDLAPIFTRLDAYQEVAGVGAAEEIRAHLDGAKGKLAAGETEEAAVLGNRKFRLRSGSKSGYGRYVKPPVAGIPVRIGVAPSEKVGSLRKVGPATRLQLLSLRKGGRGEHQQDRQDSRQVHG